MEGYWDGNVVALQFNQELRSPD